MIKTKTIKTPLMMAVAFRPTFCSSCLVPKSTLLHNPEAQYGFVPKHSLHGGKNPKNGILDYHFFDYHFLIIMIICLSLHANSIKAYGRESFCN